MSDSQEEIPDSCPIFDEGSSVKERPWCPHQSFDLDVAGEQATCRKCGLRLSPAKLLREVMVGRRVLPVLADQVKRARADLEKAQAEERLAKSRTRNAKRKDADAAVAKARELWERDLRRSEWNLQQIARLSEKVQRALYKNAKSIRTEEPREGEEREDTDG